MVAERSVIPMKPGNAGGGKGPWFKTNVESSEGLGDWATYKLREVLFRNYRQRYMRKHEVLSESRVQQICMLGSMSGMWKRDQGYAIEAPPDERGGNR